MEFARTVGTAACVRLLVCPAVSLAQNAGADQVRATRRTTLLLWRFNLLVSKARPATAVVGSVWSPTNRGRVGVAVGLRNVVTGEVVTTITDDAGDYSFDEVPEGTYLVEVTGGQDSNVVALGDLFTVRPGETVAVFMKVPAPAMAQLQASTAGGGSGDGSANSPTRSDTDADATDSTTSSDVNAASTDTGSDGIGGFGGDGDGGGFAASNGGGGGTAATGNTVQQPPPPNVFTPSLPAVTSSAGSAGVAPLGGGNASSNDDQPR